MDELGGLGFKENGREKVSAVRSPCGRVKIIPEKSNPQVPRPVLFLLAIQVYIYGVIPSR